MSIHRKQIAVLGALLAAAAVVVIVSTALASSTSVTVKSANNSSLGHRIVVDATGHTLYTLSGETKSHLICTGGCLGVWPPFTVKSATTKLKAGAGVKGKLTLLKRAGVGEQVLLGGKPLYHFGKEKPGVAGGQGIKDGTAVWSTIKVGSSTSTGTTTTSSTPAPVPGGGYAY